MDHDCFLFNLFEKMSPNFFEGPELDYLGKYKDRILSALRWMRGNVFEEVWIVYNAFFLPDGIEERNEESKNNPTDWRFRIESICFVKRHYEEEKKKEEDKVGGSERFLRLQTGLLILEAFFEYVKKEAEIRQNEALEIDWDTVKKNY